MSTLHTIPEELIETFIKEAAGEMDIGGCMVPAINAPIILLDALRASMLASKPPFAVIYWDGPEGRSFILFSDEHGIDVSKVARVYRGTGDMYTAAFQTPPQKEMSGEMIPLYLEFPPDDLEVLALIETEKKSTYIRNLHHDKDGTFDRVPSGCKVLAWSYMPEIPDSLQFGIGAIN